MLLLLLLLLLFVDRYLLIVVVVVVVVLGMLFCLFLGIFLSFFSFLSVQKQVFLDTYDGILPSQAYVPTVVVNFDDTEEFSLAF